MLSTVHESRCQQVLHSIPKQSAQLKVTYLGTSGWEISDGDIVILIDPYFSRLRRSDWDSTYIINSKVVKDTRKAFKRSDFIAPDSAAVNKHVKKVDYILVHHTHADHVLDVPYIAMKTGATIIGSESMANLMSACALSQKQMITVKGGEDYDFGNFSIKVIPSLHSPLMEKRYFDSNIIPKDIKLPLKLDDYVEGGSVAFLIRIGGYKILTSGSMNYIEKELQGLHPDIAIVGAAPSRKEIYDYAGRLMRVLNYPTIVLPTHWDDFNIPFEASQNKMLSQLQSFQQEIIKASPKTKVIIPQYFKPITIPLEK